MPTQAEIGAHLDLSQQEVSTFVNGLGIDWRNEEMSTIRLAYIRKLRAVAAGHKSHDGMDLTRERVLTEQVDREIKQFELAEKKGQLVNLQQLEPELMQMVGAWKTEVLGLPDLIKSELDPLYAVDIDVTILEALVNDTLTQLARYDPERQGAAASSDRAAGAGAEDDDDGMGSAAPADVEQEHGQAG